MAHFLRAKQAGVENDLSDLIQNDSFVIDDVSTQVRSEDDSSTSRYSYDDMAWRHKSANWHTILFSHCLPSAPNAHKSDQVRSMYSDRSASVPYSPCR